MNVTQISPSKKEMDETAEALEEFFAKEITIPIPKSPLKLLEEASLKQDNEITNLQNKAEELYFELEDLKETNYRLTADCDNFRIKNLSLTGDVIQLRKELEISESNRKHAVGLFESLNLTIKEADKIIKELRANNSKLEDTIKRHVDTIEYKNSLLEMKERYLQNAEKIVEELREKVSQSEVNKINAEHLAKQAIRLQNDNVRLMADNTGLRETDYKLTQKVGELNTEIGKQKEEIETYQKQVTRLLEQQVTYDCQASGAKEIGSLCGGCLECQLKQAQNILINLGKEKDALVNERDSLERVEKLNLTRIDELVVNVSTEKFRADQAEKFIETMRTTTNNLTAEINDHKKVCGILQLALLNITEAGVFARKDIAKQALADQISYIKNHPTMPQL